MSDLATPGDPAGRVDRVTVVVGNPRAGSRTLGVAEEVARRAAAAAGLTDRAGLEWATIDLAEVGPQLFDWSSDAVKAQAATLAGSRLAVIASPTFKATYTGLLKLFLEWFGQTGLSGVTAVPVMVGGVANHALSVEVHLRPLLVEIGASVPTRGLYVLDNELDELPSLLDAWLVEAEPLLRAAVGRSAVGGA
jgi:FMN reductase